MSSYPPVVTIADRRCAICERALNVHEAARGKTCDDARCKRLYLRFWLVEERKRKARFRRRMLRVRSRILAALGETDARTFPLAPLPHNTLRVVNLPARRWRMHRDRLDRVVSEAARQAASREIDQPAPAHQPDGPAGELAVLAAGCAACGGHCCAKGEGHAFLDAATLRRYMAQHPEARPRDVLAAYLSRVPTRSYSGSCVYHAEQGCALPRGMRSNTCNEFYCSGLEQLREGMAKAGTRRGLAVTTVEGKVVRTAIVDEAGLRDVPRAGPLDDTALRPVRRGGRMRRPAP